MQRTLPSFIYFSALTCSMRCTHCDKCCQDTEMQLCEADIVRLERGGYDRNDFANLGDDGIPRLRNSDGYCYFYNRENRRCREYRRRPLGCVIYPVNLSTEGDLVVDDLCPEASSVGEGELGRKGRRLRRLLDTIALEARRRTTPPE